MPIKYRNNRAININANIIISSVCATLIASYPVHLTKLLTDSIGMIVMLSFLFDTTTDFFIFSGLHIITHKHHVKRFRLSKTITKDIYKIQVQRVFLAMLFFVIAASIQYNLLTAGIGRVPSFLAAYLTALIVARSVHTFYGYKTGLFDPI